jgi:phosphate transport system substrate-binding protein
MAVPRTASREKEGSIMSQSKVTRLRLKPVYVAACALTAAIVLASCSSGSGSSTPTTSPKTNSQLAADLKAAPATLTAAGSTFVQPFFTAAFYDYSGKNQQVQVNYQGVGSGAGITDFEQGSVNFAASDVPMSAKDLAAIPASKGAVLQIPDILGGVALSYNVPGIKSGLKLNGSTLVGIFDGTITQWNAPQIASLNPAVSLPAHAITTEVRADSSGTTYIFTDYLSSVSKAFATSIGTSKTPAWPASAVATPKNSGVAASIKSTPYSIGYMELAYALQNNFSNAAVENSAGKFLLPTLATVASDAFNAHHVTPTNFSIVNEAGAASYPIAGYSWAILLMKQANATTGGGIVKVLDWTTQTAGGQRHAKGLGYVALPAAIQASDRASLGKVTGPSGTSLLTS